ncbi:MAG: hypothetical protein DI587_31390 [Variovorax paradoxus]|nr:MAG: hypothetical protein DI583_31390 [Variovorax paradoxus]PZQ03165.1 MAG: hypothetical protein DI587_31390 [Variovorax paradoxus]
MPCTGCAARRAWLAKWTKVAYERARTILEPRHRDADPGHAQPDAGHQPPGSQQRGAGARDGRG